MTDPVSPRLFCFGLGYTGRFLARALLAEGWRVAGTCQSPERRTELEAMGIEAWLLDRDRPLVDPMAALAGTTHLLSSVPPDAQGDTVLDLHVGDLRALGGGLRWAGYLSTTGVYGDTGGAVVDEAAPVNPSTERGRRRAAAEEQWLNSGLPVHIFRLSGIYGPGSSPLDKVRASRARRVDRPGHVFGRIHVADIVQTLRASMAQPSPGAVYNLADDEPAAPAEVTAFACDLLGIEPPPLVPFEQAERDMSPMERSFWRDNRRVDNRRIKTELGVTLRYPDYRSGLRAVLAAEPRET